jgi:hypothetical protein
MRRKRVGLRVKPQAPSAVARLKIGFGDPGQRVRVEHFALPMGVDIAPLLQQFTGQRCGASHWAYVIEGGLSVTDSDGSTDTIEPGELFPVSSGQSVRVEQDSAVLMFSPRHADIEVLVPVQMRPSTYRH